MMEQLRKNWIVVVVAMFGIYLYWQSNQAKIERMSRIEDMQIQESIKNEKSLRLADCYKMAEEEYYIAVNKNCRYLGKPDGCSLPSKWISNLQSDHLKLRIMCEKTIIQN